MKQLIKRIAQAIAEVLDNTAYANEMDALIDFGEWSGSEPDFSEVIKNWNLSRKSLIEMSDLAAGWAKTFGEKIPSITRTSASSIYKYGPYIPNPWEERDQALNCIFMAGNLLPEVTKEEVIQSLANATTTYYQAHGHTKAERNRLYMIDFQEQLRNMGVEIPSDDELLKIGVFNGNASN